MRSWTILLLLPWLLGSACVPILQPVYTEADTYLDDALPGVWIADDDEQTWRCAARDGAYAVEVEEEGAPPAAFVAHLTRIHDTAILDLYPENPDCAPHAPLDLHLPVHVIVKVTLHGDTMRLQALDPQWLEDLLEANPLGLAHAWTTEDDLVITAGTAELRRFIGDHLETPGAFTEIGTMRRQGAR